MNLTYLNKLLKKSLVTFSLLSQLLCSNLIYNLLLPKSTDSPRRSKARKKTNIYQVMILPYSTLQLATIKCLLLIMMDGETHLDLFGIIPSTACHPFYIGSFLTNGSFPEDFNVEWHQFHYFPSKQKQDHQR